MVSKKVKFTEMKDGDKEDYLLLKELEKSYISMTSDRIIEELKRQIDPVYLYSFDSIIVNGNGYPKTLLRLWLLDIC